MQVKKFIKDILTVFGGLSFLGFILAGGYFFAEVVILPSKLSAQVDQARPKDLNFVLTWAGMPESANIVSVVHSYVSARSFEGHHVNAYCLKLDHSPDQTFFTKRASWVNGPLDNPLLLDSLKLITDAGLQSDLAWFPSMENINSERFSLCFHTLSLRNLKVDSLQVILYDRKLQLLYYAEAS